MDNYLGKTYQILGDPFWCEESLLAWKNSRCVQGIHLWDEVLSTDRHYLFCDACEKTTDDLSIEVKKYKE